MQTTPWRAPVVLPTFGAKVASSTPIVASSSHPWWRARFVRSVVIVAATVGALDVGFVPAARASDPPATVPAGTVQAVSQPGVTLALPADGRINGYGFAGDILGVAAGGGDPALDLVAGSGQRLWVFGLDWDAAVTADSDGDPIGVTQVSAFLTFDGQQVSVPLAQAPGPSTDNSGAAPASSDSGPQYFVASVPVDAPDVAVVMSASGFSQEFSLSHMSRQGTQPAALYRTPGSWQTTVTLDDEKDLPTPYSDGGTVDLPGAELTIHLPSVTLSYFGPDGTSDPAPTTSQAWLVPQLEDPCSIPRIRPRACSTAATSSPPT